MAKRDPEGFRKCIKGARARDLMARQLLLHPDQLETATAEALTALKNYIQERGWSSLYGHDRRMYYLLKQAAEKLRQKWRCQPGALDDL